MLMDMARHSKPWSGPLPSGVRLSKDLAYGSGALEKIDVYWPERAQNAPLVVMVHGGGWSRGDKSSESVVANKVRAWTARGVAVASVNYTMIPQADPYQQAVGVARAIGWLRAHARDFGADPDRMTLMGHSAGAHLVALIEADPSVAIQAGIARGWLGVIALDGGSIDVEDTMRRDHARLFDQAFGSQPAFWKKASPMAHLALRASSSDPGPRLAPMLLVCSSPRPESCSQSLAFAALARSLGGRAETLQVPLNHEQINMELGSPGSYTSRVEAFMASVGSFGPR